MNASLYVVRVLTSFYNYKREMVEKHTFSKSRVWRIHTSASHSLRTLKNPV